MQPTTPTSASGGMTAEELTQQLTQERLARLELWMQHQQLLAEVELLRNEAMRKDAELRVAGSALVHIHNGHQVQDLVEVNIALEEQVKSLKHMVQMMQQHSGEDKQGKPRTRRTQSASAKQGANPIAEPYEVVLGRVATENDPIAMWDATLALIRGGYWLHAEGKIKALKEKLAEERKESAALRKELADVEGDKLRLNEHKARSDLLEQQLCEREKELLETSKELELLQQKHQDESAQHRDAIREAVQPAKATNAEKDLESAAALWKRT
ncbi:hypothetical protein FI667_g9782, partial [Globisporangium splendens]